MEQSITAEVLYAEMKKTVSIQGVSKIGTMADEADEEFL